MADETKIEAVPVAAKRRWFRFSLRSLLVLVVVLAVPLGWVAKERRQSQREMEIAVQLQRLGVTHIEFGGPYDSREWPSGDKNQVWWQDLAEQILGRRVVLVSTHAEHLSPILENVSLLADLKSLQFLDLFCTQVSNIKPLAELKNLQFLGLHHDKIIDIGPLRRFACVRKVSLDLTKVTDLTPLAEYKELELLSLSCTHVSDLTPLAALDKLQVLRLNSTKVRDITPLFGLTGLRTLDLNNTQVSSEQVAKLQKALPNCKIWFP